MNEQRPNVPTKPEPIDEKDQASAGHGDKLVNAVEKVASGTKPAREAKDLKGDEVME